MPLSKNSYSVILIPYQYKGYEMTPEKEKNLLNKIESIGTFILVAGVFLALFFLRA